jgi:hypothetical protein
VVRPRLASVTARSQQRAWKSTLFLPRLPQVPVRGGQLDESCVDAKTQELPSIRSRALPLGCALAQPRPTSGQGRNRQCLQGTSCGQCSPARVDQGTRKATRQARRVQGARRCSHASGSQPSRADALCGSGQRAIQRTKGPRAQGGWKRQLNLNDCRQVCADPQAPLSGHACSRLRQRRRESVPVFNL